MGRKKRRTMAREEAEGAAGVGSEEAETETMKGEVGERTNSIWTRAPFLLFEGGALARERKGRTRC